MHLDALTGWQTVVELAKQSDVIFNGVDLGAMWDMAVSALGLELGVPVVAGQSYDWLWDTEYYANTPGHRCSHCQKGLKSFDDWLSGQAAHFGARPGRDQDRLVARMFGDAEELSLDAVATFYATDRDFLVSGPTMRAILSDSLAAAAGGALVLTKAQCPAFLDAVFRRSLRRMLPVRVRTWLALWPCVVACGRMRLTWHAAACAGCHLQADRLELRAAPSSRGHPIRRFLGVRVPCCRRAHGVHVGGGPVLEERRA